MHASRVNATQLNDTNSQYCEQKSVCDKTDVETKSRCSEHERAKNEFMA